MQADHDRIIYQFLTSKPFTSLIFVPFRSILFRMVKSTNQERVYLNLNLINNLICVLSVAHSQGYLKVRGCWIVVDEGKKRKLFLYFFTST